jgi:hypothetical protein
LADTADACIAQVFTSRNLAPMAANADVVKEQVEEFKSVVPLVQVGAQCAFHRACGVLLLWCMPCLYFLAAHSTWSADMRSHIPHILGQHLQPEQHLHRFCCCVLAEPAQPRHAHTALGPAHS